METNTTNTAPAVGTTTANLLHALRHVEAARNCFFDAFDAVGGDDYANVKLYGPDPFHDGPFIGAVLDTARDLIQKELTERATLWAENREEKAEF